MSLKTKRHTQHRIEEQKAEASIQKRASRNRKLAGIIGSGVGVATYMMRSRLRDFVNNRFGNRSESQSRQSVESENLQNLRRVI